AWILTDGLRQIGGRCATALFGNSAELLADGNRPLALVPGIRAGGGTAFAGDAIELVSDRLEMTNPRRPRFVYVLSDGGWSDTRAGVERIHWLAELGVPTVHLSIGIAPLCRRARRPPRPSPHPLNQILKGAPRCRNPTRPRCHAPP